MSSIGRLWRRAPAWRLCLVSAVAATALAGMFPPTRPDWLPMRSRSLSVSMDKGATASFVPQPDQVPADYATLARPPLSTPLSGVIPFNGRQLPLPAGEWQVIERGRSAAAGGTANVQVETFARLAGNSMTGVLVALTPDPVSGGLPPAGLMRLCLASSQLARQIAPATPDDPLANECWTLGRTSVRFSRDSTAPGDLVLPEVEHFAKAGMAVPQRVLALDYRRSDRRGWETITLVLPDKAGSSPAELRRLQAWARNAASLLHRGFDGGFEARLPPAAIRDPE